MAFSISSSIAFCPQALSRSNPNKSKNPRRKPSPKSLKPPNPKLPPSKPLSSLSGGDATTYTRLPLRDDSFFSPFASPPPQLSTEIKLSDLILPNLSDQDQNGKPSNNNNNTSKPSVNKFGSENDELELDDGKFELYEVNSDDEDDDEVEFGVGPIEEGDADEEVEEKEKGVPAVMRCFDRAKIFVKAGDGGDGVMAFRREKYVPLGGPSGGDGGRGGNVYMEVDSSMSSLLPFRQSIHFRAGRGSHGQGKNMHGAKGEDVVVKVPPGTVVKDGEGGKVLLELLRQGDKALVLPGGRGGRGNASFKSGLNKVPKIAEDGEEGAEM